MQSIITSIQKALIAEFATLQDCCTTANYCARELLSEEHEVQRVRGTVQVFCPPTQETYTYDHEWLLVDGKPVDITVRQFGLEAVSEKTHHGEVVDWHRLTKVEAEEVATILARI